MTETAAQTVAQAPTPKEIDALVAEYAAAQTKAAASGKVSSVDDKAVGVIKVKLTAMVEAFGFRHTPKSKRLVGLHNTATTTTGTRPTIDDAAVEKFKSYLGGAKMPPDLVDRFFSTHTSYSMVAAPTEILKTLTLGGHIRARMTVLLALCNKIAFNKPSLSIEVVEPEKP